MKLYENTDPHTLLVCHRSLLKGLVLPYRLIRVTAKELLFKLSSFQHTNPLPRKIIKALTIKMIRDY